ncbi:microcephalin [Sphaeramia orbicularis]|uniref:BRCT domain-containing protein n=1 Tax=Sphaeramia orbicularis TaxID=375764 RepID=A0A673B6D5_9TELE|nr:microcephalin [Sphaeramia orbicularis]XP_030011420.1 microcephalin [Sphaeramia orbicularis]XP_030011421.1 microcephalin [Sphaeramia orbicularis]
MTTRSKSSVLKDVVAYVDVWSSDKTANYSKPFIQQLQDMGAQVSKTFNKQVTHVVFNNGHPATWKKAKKTNLKLVSVLWVGRCYDDCVHVDEMLYPALNDESNPMLKNKKHRCMQPKDSPEKTPENDRRMKRKLDKMMKDFAPQQPLVTDFSPIIIDEENGIVYSPSLNRSDYMERRLKAMKEKRENLSPTASQMIESCSPLGLKPSLGCTPTVFKFPYDNSDDDSSASVAETGYSPDKEEGRKPLCVSDHGHEQPKRNETIEKPWLSPCHDVLRSTSISSLKCPDFEENKDQEGEHQKRSRRTSVKKHITAELKSVSESPRPDGRSNNDKGKRKDKGQSQIKSSSFAAKQSKLSPKKSDTGKQKGKDKYFKETKTTLFPDTVKPSKYPSLTDISCDAAAAPPEETTSPLQKNEQKLSKRARPSLPALVRPFPLPSESQSAASGSTKEDDNAFEDYFSPVNHKKKLHRPLCSGLPVEKDIQVPFVLDSYTKKRKQRRSESVVAESCTVKKRKVEESQSAKTQLSDAMAEHPQQDSRESPPELDNPGVGSTLMVKRRRQSTLPFTSTSVITTDVIKTRASTSVEPTNLKEADMALEMQTQSDVSDLCQTLKSRGNEHAFAGGKTETPSADQNKQVSSSLQNMVNKTKVMRTLVMTSMPTEKQNTVIQVVQSLGGFSIVDRVCESTTHVVSGGHRRTLNILLGIARGCWILSFEWILWCLEKRQWIPEEPYELSDHFPAAQICRLQRHLSAGEHQQDLFQGQPAMFVSQHSQPPTQSLVELIQLCGGTVCKTVRQAGLCIGKYSGRRPEGSRILSEQWVLDSITHLKQLSYDKYDLE